MSAVGNTEKLNRIKWRTQCAFEVYGVRIGIRADAANLEAKLKTILPENRKDIGFEEAADILSLVAAEDKRDNGLYFNDEMAMRFEQFDDSLLEFVAEKILTILAFVSLPSKFYLHAGAVAWNNSGIVIPGESYAGKTTLVKEFIKAGAEYFSDDCVILDKRGFLLPFPRALAVRTGEGRVIKNAADFGAKNAGKKVKLGTILLTRYEKEATWRPAAVSRGQGILELMKNFYYQSSVSKAPEEIISNLTDITRKALIIGGRRGEACAVIEWFLENFPLKKSH